MYGPAITQHKANLPICKETPIQATDEIAKLRDFRPLTQENLQNNELRFFTPNPSNRDSVERQYEQNPLPRNTSKQVLAIGFSFDKIVQEGNGSLDPIGILNAISHAEVRFKKDQGRSIMIQQHSKRWIDLDEASDLYAASNDGTNSAAERAVNLPNRPLFKVADTQGLILGPDERFDLEIQFDDTSGIPAEADYDTPLQMGAFMQINRDPFS